MDTAPAPPRPTRALLLLLLALLAPAQLSLRALGAGLVPHPIHLLPDLIVRAGQPISGAYHHVTVLGSGHAALAGPLIVYGTLTVQPGGSLRTATHVVGGPGRLQLLPGATLLVGHPEGLSTRAARGAVQLGGLRFFSPEANYVYDGHLPQLTGDGLPPRVRNLTVANPAGLTLSQDLTVTQQLRRNVGNLTPGRARLVAPSPMATSSIRTSSAYHALPAR